jgi:hypothetical protein
VLTTRHCLLRTAIWGVDFKQLGGVLRQVLTFPNAGTLRALCYKSSFAEAAALS